MEFGHFRSVLRSLPSVVIVGIEGVRVIEEAGRDDDTTLLVDQRITTLADALVDAIQTELELILAALRRRAGGSRRSRCRLRLRRRDQAVLGTRAFGIERREHDAVVQLHRY